MFHVRGKHHGYVSIIHLVQVPSFDNARHYKSATGVGCNQLTSLRHFPLEMHYYCSSFLEPTVSEPCMLFQSKCIEVSTLSPLCNIFLE